ncbi:MAG: DUF2905 domain-containing protein [Chloroflexus sp.]|jgi:uncharacterized protein HemY|uniref:DUF2905 domain-containing protein n=1 Tax=unclassified Chloroflexus TaxID=2633855 RepID=UPI0004DF38E0|nr:MULTISPECIES: DUF2905 domain-containing protein [unclassified Chloroflexus]MBO9310754.1 DUF2905 domain-containing protein [Chloroflexus sp.]MBO9316497.1 DUF2905 domain-containing protein [Chloroflexus sp.]MBO9317811.1 DUF2905 domain-containing protein [Chloroflexus sp.]MBO9339337.1 DUF2905 domain-containing protein [Chloroflexus sp.]MBO9347812.1 DUF2905 domain-containing protein [Chloroflexus sp.]
MTEIGRWLIGVGILLVVIGLVMMAAGRLPWLGRLPGDILIERDNLTIFIPLGTMLVVSLILTIIANVIARWWR